MPASLGQGDKSYARAASESRAWHHVGAMPPFGTLYDLNVYVDRPLTEDNGIVSQMGAHREAINMRYRTLRPSSRQRWRSSIGLGLALLMAVDQSLASQASRGRAP